MSIDADLAAAIALAETEATARVAAAVGAAGIAAAATEQSAVTQAQADTTVATTTSNAQKVIAQTNATADVQVASISAVAQETVASTNLTGTEYGADRQLDGVEYSQNAETARLNTTLAFAQDKWNQIFPLIQGFLANPDEGGSSSLSFEALVTALGAAPWITQGGVWTPSQIQSQLNALYARSDQKAATLLHDAQIDLAGRGFGGSSPLIDMLRFSYDAEAMATSTEGAQQIALQSGQANAEQLLSQQQQRQAQYEANERTFAELQRIAVELSTGVLQAVAQIVSATVR
jgi:hypothetical protein